ncbi:MAG: LysR family transcriptional regulator [Lachnospiraceae bacterium]|nr:LysR family transcriptional regulator [Lachnospiraceae bacterium]
MEIRQIQYMLAIAEEGNISHAAEKLFITQSALNHQLLNLERELGVSLFDRIGRGVRPTAAGKIYLENARKMLDIRNETYKILADFSEVRRGEISIAFSRDWGSRIFSMVYPRFHALYPGFTFRTHEVHTSQIDQLLEKREISLGFAGFRKEPNPLFEYHKIYPVHLILAVPISHPLAKVAGEDSWKRRPVLDLDTLQQIEYLVMPSKGTFLRKLCDELFTSVSYQPNILFESANTRTLANMVINQVAPAVLPESFIEEYDKTACFSLGNAFSGYQSITSLKDSYLSKAERAFIDIYNEVYDEYVVNAAH